jgi:nitroimidazol reductase NimA-like FMN-containing flavoprotein (pyridoxamine 5'-phosphate oxidase superfamily)
MTNERNDPDQVPDELRIRREAERAGYGREIVDQIVDAALVAHVGTVRAGKAIVVPMFCVRDRDWLLLHGAPAAGTMRRGRGIDVCVTVTLLDGLVLARSAFNHSLNYRSVVVLGTAEVIADEAERARALDVIAERLVPGRSAQLRPTTGTELRQTAVLRISLEKASTKVRSGPPEDDEADYDWPVWAGVVPIDSAYGVPEPDPRVGDDVGQPDNVTALEGKTL